jgi:hypothetical protein
MTSFPTRACASLSLPKTESSDAYLTDVDGNVSELEGPIHPPLGSGDDKPTFTPTGRQLGSGERLIFVTDGVTHRRTESGGG